MDLAGRCLGASASGWRREQADLGSFAASGDQRRTRDASSRRAGTFSAVRRRCVKEPSMHLTVSQPWEQPVGGRGGQRGVPTAWVMRRCQVAVATKALSRP